MKKAFAAGAIACILFGLLMAVKAIVFGFLIKAALIAAAFGALALGIVIGTRTAWRHR
jgi:hypothetical protein